MSFDIGKVFADALPAIEAAKGVTGLVEQADPMNIGITAICDFLGVPSEVKNGVKLGLGLATFNVLLAADGALGLAEDIGQNSAGETEYWLPENQRSGTGYAVDSCDPEVKKQQEYAAALLIINKRYEDFDKGRYVGITEGDVTAESIAAWENSPDPEMRKVAKFFKENPECLAQLDAAGGTDGKFTKEQVRGEISKTRSQIMSGSPALEHQNGKQLEKDEGASNGGSGGGTSGATGPSTSVYSDRLQSILKDPTLSIEEKILMILMLVTEALDEQLEHTAAELGQRTLDRIDIADSANKSEASTEDKKKLAQHDTGTEKLQLQLQRLMEKRSQMFQMMSSMSSNFNEMAKCAIQNMGRA